MGKDGGRGKRIVVGERTPYIIKAYIIVDPHLVVKAPLEKKGHKARRRHEYKMRSEQQIDSWQPGDAAEMENTEAKFSSWGAFWRSLRMSKFNHQKRYPKRSEEWNRVWSEVESDSWLASFRQMPFDNAPFFFSEGRKSGSGGRGGGIEKKRGVLMTV